MDNFWDKLWVEFYKEFAYEISPDIEKLLKQKDPRSKELTPLEAFKRFKNNLQWLEENVANLKGYFENKKLYFKEDLDSIETAIKDYQTLKREYDFGVEHYNELLNDYNKEHKALEIIKKLFYKYRSDIELVASYEDGKPIYLLRMGKKKINRKWIYLLILTKEEYDLLKEVLL